MIEFKLKEALEERGKSAYWLAKETNIQQATIWRMKVGRGGAIKFDSLDKICNALECQPGDLIIHRPDNKKGNKK